MKDKNELFKPIADLPPILSDFLSQFFVFQFNPYPPKNIQLGSNLS